MLTLEIFTKPVKNIPDKDQKYLCSQKIFWLEYLLQEYRLIQEHQPNTSESNYVKSKVFESVRKCVFLWKVTPNACKRNFGSTNDNSSAQMPE